MSATAASAATTVPAVRERKFIRASPIFIIDFGMRNIVPFPNMADQLKAGNVDAVEALEPFAGQLLAAGNRSLSRPTS
jgi:hypothetical protein